MAKDEARQVAQTQLPRALEGQQSLESVVQGNEALLWKQRNDISILEWSNSSMVGTRSREREFN